ncbi:SAP domain-containing protein [Arthrobacter sp. zg-Y820]|nr:SAP domain-containing protein [Arthrobacter sp. zg-Y820]
MSRFARTQGHETTGGKQMLTKRIAADCRPGIPSNKGNWRGTRKGPGPTKA